MPATRQPAADTALTLLTLNLHTYQEVSSAGVPESELTHELALQRIEAYGPVFDRIAAGIVALDPDIICLQEVGEWPGARSASEQPEFGSSETNMARQILSRLPRQRYQVTMDWSHYGWGVWLEGSAILSKHPISHSESRFISAAANGQRANWKSRNVPMARIEVPSVGAVQVFSVHTGWWDDPDEPFREQYERLLRWTAEIEEPDSATILCGDFNVAAGGPGYLFMTSGTGFADQYLLANPDGMNDATIGDGVDGWEDSDVAQRIDYILMNDGSPLQIKKARRVFTASEFGRVSDHVGIHAEFVARRGQ